MIILLLLKNMLICKWKIVYITVLKKYIYMQLKCNLLLPDCSTAVCKCLETLHHLAFHCITIASASKNCSTLSHPLSYIGTSVLPSIVTDIQLVVFHHALKMSGGCFLCRIIDKCYSILAHVFLHSFDIGALNETRRHL